MPGTHRQGGIPQSGTGWPGARQLRSRAWPGEGATLCVIPVEIVHGKGGINREQITHAGHAEIGLIH